MEVETFEIEEAVGEVSGSAPEIEAAAVALIDSLGLEGQRELLEPSRGADTGMVSRIPYPKLDSHERAVYAALYPTKDRLDQYSAGAIPLRVLQVIEHAKKHSFFENLYVWHSKRFDPDPILVGRNGNEWDGKWYILARWGDALKPFKELAELARVTLYTEWERECKAKIGECQAFIQRLESNIEEHLRGRYVGHPF